MEADMVRMQVKDQSEMAQQLMDTKNKLEEALRKMAESECTRRQLHHTIQELKSSIRVFTRVRPMFHAGAKVDAAGDTNMLTNDDAINAIEVSQDGRKLRLDD
jgi:septal ring factor EnvC (AmiA/AmiB activator)